MRRAAGLVCAVLFVAGCMADMTEAQTEALDEVVPIGLSDGLDAFEVAHEVIVDTRPEATRLVVSKLNLALVNSGIMDTIDADDLEEQVDEPLTDGEPPVTCPYLTPSGGEGAAVSCRYVVDRAVDDAMLEGVTLQSDVEQDVEDEYGPDLDAEGLDFVSGWVGEAVLAGIDTGAAHTITMLRDLSICDQAPTQTEAAYALGQGQGRALLESAEAIVLPTIPRTQCNTDVIAAAILAEARQGVDGFNAANPVCDGYDPTELAEAVDLAQAENNRRRGVDEGVREAHEALRVRLVDTWECVPCKCYIRYSGAGPTQCFQTDSNEHPQQLINQGIPMIPQSECSSTPVAVGSPLVVDLDGDGIRLATERVPFDLAATGEPATIPALVGGDALVAMDLDGNGTIDSGAELFGNATRCGEERCVDGLEALAQHDSNGDGTLDGDDPVFARLRLWTDGDRDGRSTSSELRTLSGAGIAAVELDSRLDLAWADGRGNSVTRSLQFVRQDGGRGVVQDVWFSLQFTTLPRDPRSSGRTSSLPQRDRRSEP